MGNTTRRLPVSLIDLLVLRAAAQGPTHGREIERRYLKSLALFTTEAYSPDTGSVRMAVERLHQKGYLATTDRRKYKACPGKTERRHIVVTSEGTQILTQFADTLGLSESNPRPESTDYEI